MQTMTKRLEIDAGHRLLKHEGKCRNVHGHRYAFEVTCAADVLDSCGRIIDFGEVKERVGGWLADNLDHGFIAQEGDPIIDWLKEQRQKLYILENPPTAENLARLVLIVARALLAPMGIEVVNVRCYETPTGWSDYDGA